MKTFVAGREALTATEFASLALGFDVELFAGLPGESALARAARLDAAAELLAELEREDPIAAAYAAELLGTSPLNLRRVVIPRSAIRAEVAA
ncbi:hypothetical protein [Streptacidiphilus neutrinimicus]|uniref:hypothetical protein n=1 Tax=Streptacidiphilus neutrinimicus TaxID=105420 RepID=UPI0005A75DB7|nr:hypothetical protein [Streptacidiphilus neutrinimicus]